MTDGDAVVLTLNINIPITRQDIEDIIVTMLEGGCNYWCEEIDIPGERFESEPTSIWCARMLLAEHVVRLRDEDDWHMLTLLKLESGIKLWFIDTGAKLTEGRLEIGDIDAGQADMILQYALFGEVVYG